MVDETTINISHRDQDMITIHNVTDNFKAHEEYSGLLWYCKVSHGSLAKNPLLWRDLYNRINLIIPPKISSQSCF